MGCRYWDVRGYRVEKCQGEWMVKFTVKCGGGRVSRWVEGEVDNEVWMGSVTVDGW